MAEKKSTGNGYIGKISNKGAQVVEAPIPQSAAKKGVVSKGKDLRGGKNGK